MELLQAIVNLLSRVSLLIVLMYIVLSFYTTRKLMVQIVKTKSSFYLGLLGALFGIMGTYLGIWYKGAIMNYRDVGVIFTAFIGGFPTAIIAGGISSIHRFLLGGVSAIPCAIGTFLSGLIAATAVKINNYKVTLSFAFLVTFIAEVLHITIARYMIFPENLAIDITHKIFIPMVIANTFGVTLLTGLVLTSEYRVETASRKSVSWIISIFEKLLEILTKECYNEKENFLEVLRTIVTNSPIDGAMFIISNKIIVQFPESEKFEVNLKKLKTSKKEYNLRENKWYIVFPIPFEKEITHYLIIKISNFNEDSLIFFGEKISQILKLMLTVTSSLKEAKLAKEAQIREFTSKLSPHFFFNTLSVIRYNVKNNPKDAILCIDQLSNLLMYLFQKKDKLVPLSEEMEAIKNYLKIMSIRYPDVLNYKISYQTTSPNVVVPPFIFQPIIENAIKYGKKNGKISVEISCKTNKEYLMIQIKDHGPGIKGKLKKGTGLSLVEERLKLLYSSFSIDYKTKNGLTVSIKLPLKREETISSLK
ncbi:MAG: histidine kinase [Thermosipho sp. (in: Bacteria)]|nr:histidine kinase [Thermosipho sp. (in: thermotogales)]